MLSGPYKTPASYCHMQEAIDLLRGCYLQFKSFPIGKSAGGRDITALCIGSPAGSSLYIGGIRGREWLTATVLLRFYGNLLHGVEHGGCVSDINVGSALADRPVTIIPCLNPDGADISLGKQAPQNGEPVPCQTSQGNGNGVDISFNFDAGWRNTLDGGPHPGSEPETQALTAFCLHYRPRSLYCLRCPGESIHYHYGANTPARSRMIGQILASSAGYALAKPDSPALHGSPMGWFIEKSRKPGFMIEIGDTDMSSGQSNRTYYRVEEMLMLAALL